VVATLPGIVVLAGTVVLAGIPAPAGLAAAPDAATPAMLTDNIAHTAAISPTRPARPLICITCDYGMPIDDFLNYSDITQVPHRVLRTDPHANAAEAVRRMATVLNF
jgi:hypothetical protein